MRLLSTIRVGGLLGALLHSTPSWAEATVSGRSEAVPSSDEPDETTSRGYDPHPPWGIVNLAYGAGAMEFYNNDKAILPVTVVAQGALRLRAFRFGGTLRWMHNGEGHNFVEAGAFVGRDIFSLEQDRHHTLAFYYRLEVAPRISLDRPESVSLYLGNYFGIRALGIFVEAGFGPVLGPFDLGPYPKDLIGFTGEGRVGIELIEVWHGFRDGSYGTGK